jgi:hypothetical protein
MMGAQIKLPSPVQVSRPSCKAQSLNQMIEYLTKVGRPFKNIQLEDSQKIMYPLIEEIRKLVQNQKQKHKSKIDGSSTHLIFQTQRQFEICDKIQLGTKPKAKAQIKNRWAIYPFNFPNPKTV